MTGMVGAMLLRTRWIYRASRLQCRQLAVLCSVDCNGTVSVRVRFTSALIEVISENWVRRCLRAEQSCACLLAGELSSVLTVQGVDPICTESCCVCVCKAVHWRVLAWTMLACRGP